MEWVASTLHTTSEHGVSSITIADAHTSAASSRLTDAPADLNGLVRFTERGNLVSARVPSHFNWPLSIEKLPKCLSTETTRGNFTHTMRKKTQWQWETSPNCQLSVTVKISLPGGRSYDKQWRSLRLTQLSPSPRDQPC
jgi:hypothetical protein